MASYLATLCSPEPTVYAYKFASTPSDGYIYMLPTNLRADHCNAQPATPESGTPRRAILNTSIYSPIAALEPAEYLGEQHESDDHLGEESCSEGDYEEKRSDGQAEAWSDNWHRERHERYDGLTRGRLETWPEPD